MIQIVLGLNLEKCSKSLVSRLSIRRTGVAPATEPENGAAWESGNSSDVIPEVPMAELMPDGAPGDETVESNSEPSSPEEIPHAILESARAVMVGFVELRPDEYVARLEVSSSEWMAITDDSLSNELERELLTSATAMCLWQEWMIWYQGGRTSAFTDAFGEIGPVFVRGQAAQWRIVSSLRSILRRLWD